MDEWVSLLGVILGGGGLGAILLAATQFSARSRLRSNVKRNAEALKSVKADGRAARVLQQAIDTDALRLASMSIRTASAAIRAYGVFLLGIVAVGLLWTWVVPLIGVPGPSELFGAQIPDGEARDEYLRVTRSVFTGGLLLYVLLVVIGAGATSFYLASAREKLVVRQLRKMGQLPVPVPPDDFFGAMQAGRAMRRRREEKRQARANKEATVAEPEDGESAQLLGPEGVGGRAAADLVPAVSGPRTGGDEGDLKLAE